MSDRENIDEIEDPDLDREEGDDAGHVDDEGGYEAEAGQEPEAAEAPQRVTRRDDRIREELRAEREHRSRVEQELNQLRAEREQRNAMAGEETDQQFMARIALLDRDSQVDARLERAQRLTNRQMALMAFATADRADKAAYEAKSAYDPIYKKYASEVEQVLAIERRKGRDFDRETVLDFVRGRRARMNSGKSPAKEQAERRVQRQQTAPPSGGRGDQPRQERQRKFAPNDMSPEAVRQRLFADDAFI